MTRWSKPSQNISLPAEKYLLRRTSSFWLRKCLSYFAQIKSLVRSRLTKIRFRLRQKGRKLSRKRSCRYIGLCGCWGETPSLPVGFLPQSLPILFFLKLLYYHISPQFWQAIDE